MDETPDPLEDRPFARELNDSLRGAVDQVRGEPPPAASIRRALERARRLGPGRVNPWVRYHRVAVAAAVAALLMLGFSLLLVCWRSEPGGPAHIAPPTEGGGVEVDVLIGDDPERGPPGAGGGDGRLAENPFLDAQRAPDSTFPLSVDPAVYGKVRRALLEDNRLPAPEVVRVADLVNSFTYSYPEPTAGEPASLTLDLAECPWDAAHLLARIGLRAPANAAVAAGGVQATFNPRRVSAYRLIGYEGRRARVGGGVLAAGQAVTVLYEIVPAGSADESEWLTARTLDPARPLTRSLSGPAKTLADAPADFRFAAAAAEFGLLLRDSKYKGRATYAAVRAAAGAATGADPDGRRAEFLALVDAADRITAERKLTWRDAKSS